MSYERPRPMLAARQLDILRTLAPLGIRRTRPEIVSALGGCCADAVAVELRQLSNALLIETSRQAEGMLQYALTPAGAALVDHA